MIHEPNSNITKLLTLEVALEYLVKQQEVYSGSNIPMEKRFYHDSGKHQGPRGGRFSEIGVDVDQHGNQLQQTPSVAAVKPSDPDPEAGEVVERKVVSAGEPTSGIQEDISEFATTRPNQFLELFDTFVTQATSEDKGSNSDSMRNITSTVIDNLDVTINSDGTPSIFLGTSFSASTSMLYNLVRYCPSSMLGDLKETINKLSDDLNDKWKTHRNNENSEEWDLFIKDYRPVSLGAKKRQRILDMIPSDVLDRFSEFAGNFDKRSEEDKKSFTDKILPELSQWDEMQEELSMIFSSGDIFTVARDPSQDLVAIVDELYKGTKYGRTHLFTKNEWEKSSNTPGAFLLKESIMRQLDGPIAFHDEIDYGGPKVAGGEGSDSVSNHLNQLYSKELISNVIVHNKKIIEKDESLVDHNIQYFSNKELIDDYVLFHRKVNRELMDYIFPDQDEFQIFRGVDDGDLVKKISKFKYGTDPEGLTDYDSLPFPSLTGTLRHNPIASYSLDLATAMNFAAQGQENGVILRSIVHKDDVWSSFITHAYNGNELEIITLGDNSRLTLGEEFFSVNYTANWSDYQITGVIGRTLAFDLDEYTTTAGLLKSDHEDDDDDKIIIDAGLNGDWIKIVRDMPNKPYGPEFEDKRNNDNNNLSKLLALEVALEYMVKQDSVDEKDYDPEGFHEGPRKGRYFKPGEREVGGPEVKVVQAPDALVDDDDDDGEGIGPKVGNEAFIDKMMVKGYIPLKELIKTLPRISVDEKKGLIRQAALEGKGLETDATPITPNIAVVNDAGEVTQITTADGQLQSTKEFDPKYPNRGGKRNLFFSPDKDDKVQVQWMDADGRQHVAYSTEQTKSQSVKKFNKIKRLHDVIPNIEESINSDITNVNSKDREAAIALAIIHNTFRRVGKGTSVVTWDGKDGRPGPDTDKDGKFIRKSVNTFGVTSFQPKHILVKGQKVYLNFLGKSGQLNNVEVTNPLLKEELVARKKQMGRGAKAPVLNITASKVNEYLKKVTESDEFSAKNFRTYHATRLATDLIAKTRIPKLNRESFNKHMLKSIKNGAISTPKEWKEAAYLYAIKEHNKLKLDIIGDPISKRLSNTKSVCVSNYIDPAVFKDWDSSFEAEIQKYVNTRFPKAAVQEAKIKARQKVAGKPAARKRKAGAKKK